MIPNIDGRGLIKNVDMIQFKQLMVEAETKGWVWNTGDKPTEYTPNVASHVNMDITFRLGGRIAYAINRR
jgi:hypothetical protein